VARWRAVCGSCLWHLTGPKQAEKLVGIDGLDLELPLADHLLVLRYLDRPGVIGTIGGLLGSFR
jgi:D-3-phosphoglycerate dehydrogenase